MPHATSDRQFLEKQYKDSSNLDARIQLHRRFSINPYSWHPWVFDHFDQPPHCRILELGCGPGYLWQENLGRIPPSWRITLSDFSAGMLERARLNLEGYPHFKFKVIDVQSIPYADDYFDAIIANHMLYHVPAYPTVLDEIRRVLKPSGRFYASTVGDRHLVEIRDLLVKFDPALASWGRVADSFTLENGMEQLSQWFNVVTLYRYEDALEVTEVAPLVDYILSGWAQLIIKGRQAAFREFVARAIESRGGVFHITKDSGLFVSDWKGE
jgi:ubiquinone/menaquinone biosynthesis C-methylase UbiE